MTGEVVESYTMITTNVDAHPLLSRLHRPDPHRPPEKQDKRAVVPIEIADIRTWLSGSAEDAARLVRAPPPEVFDAGPSDGSPAIEQPTLL